jgi:hypothetical protein
VCSSDLEESPFLNDDEQTEIRNYYSGCQQEEEKPTDEEIEKYLLVKYKPIFIDGGDGTDINKYYRECSFLDMKAMRDNPKAFKE